MPLVLEHFLVHHDGSGTSGEVACSTALVLGPPHSGKTTCLFQYALHATQQGGRALILCQRSQLELSPPLLPKREMARTPGWRNVQLRYLDSCNDVIRFLAGLHLVEDPPSVLAVDACLIPTGPLPGQLVNWERTLARIAATLADCANYLSTRLGTNAVVLCAAEAGDRAMTVLQRAFPLVLHLEHEEATQGVILRARMDDTPIAWEGHLLPGNA